MLANALAKHKRVIYVKQGYYHYRAGVYAPVDELHCKQIIRHYLRPDHVRDAPDQRCLRASGRSKMQVARATQCGPA